MCINFLMAKFDLQMSPELDLPAPSMEHGTDPIFALVSVGRAWPISSDSHYGWVERAFAVNFERHSIENRGHKGNVHESCWLARACLRGS